MGLCNLPAKQETCLASGERSRLDCTGRRPRRRDRVFANGANTTREVWARPHGKHIGRGSGEGKRGSASLGPISNAAERRGATGRLRMPAAVPAQE